jgi:hypothetical protein
MDDYKLKYVFSELATTNATGNHSRSLSKHQPVDSHPLPQEPPINNEEISFKNNQKVRPQRHTVNYLSNKSERNSAKKYTKQVINTDYDKKQHQ